MNIFPSEYYQDVNMEAEEIAVENLSSLKKYDPFSTLPYIGAMLAMPSLQAQCSRLEIFAFAALTLCNGKHKPTLQTLDHWVNSQLGSDEITRLEDPAEDVFVTNVLTENAEYKIIPGLWIGVDSSLCLLFETIEHCGGKQQALWLEPAKALLALSTEALKRLGLSRWAYELSIPRRNIKIQKCKHYHDLAQKMVFTQEELNSASIRQELIDGFCVSDSDLLEIKSKGLKGSCFFEKPIIKDSKGNYIIYLPTCMAYAARRSILKHANRDSQLAQLNEMSFIVSSKNALDPFCRTSNKHGIKLISIPSEINNNEVAKIYIFESGYGKFLCLCFINSKNTDSHISLDHYGAVEFSEKEERVIRKSLHTAIKYVNKNHDVVFGHILIMGGHISNSYSLEAIPTVGKWKCDNIHYSDVIMMLSSFDSPIENIITFLMQREDVQNDGLELLCNSGLLNVFSFWSINDFCLVDERVKHGTSAQVILGMDYAVEFRKNMRVAYDAHISRTIQGIATVCKRLHANSIYKNEQSLPIYASVGHAKSGVLSGYFPHGEINFWLTAKINSQNGNTRKMIFDLWSGILTLLYRFFHNFYNGIVFESDVEFFLSFNITDSIHEGLLNRQDFELSIAKHKDFPMYKIDIDDNIFSLFYGETNDGERKIFERIIDTIAAMHREIDRSLLYGNIDTFLEKSAKIIHIRQTYDIVDFLISQNKDSTYAVPKECIAHKRLQSFRWKEACDHEYIPQQDECLSLLNTSVSKSIHQLICELKWLNKRAVIDSLLQRMETLFHAKKVWKGSAQAVLALHGDEDALEAAASSEITRAQAGIAIRALIEAALCECNHAAGKVPDGYTIDALVAQMILIIEAGGLSDAIHFGLIDSGLTIKPSGTFVVNDNNFTQLSLSFAKEVHGLKFHQDASEYGFINSSHEAPDTPKDATLLGIEFSKAFRAEFGLTPDSFLDVYAAICDMAFEKEAVVLAFHRDELIEKCSSRDIAAESVTVFLENFSLKPRASWLPTDGYKPRDIQPWRFGRRLSLTNKPVIKLDVSTSPTYSIGLGLFDESIKHILSSSCEALYDKDMFSSKEMRSYIGTRVDELGHQFSKKIQSELQALGFVAETEIKMTQLGATKKPNLGDIDVLAISPSGAILAIECKRLRSARTNAEIAHTCSSFRGNTGDRLFKHLRRVEWLRDNEGSIRKFFGIPDGVNLKFYAPLVCNIPVPFKYLQDLPIPPEDVVSLSSLEEYVLSLR